jgi:serine/threonine-protein kinase
MFEPGSVVGGKYRIERVLGHGGMGVLYAATHLELGRKVALKFLLEDASREPATVERFSREARAAVKIESEHVARVFDVGELGPGHPFIVMELLDGEPLDALLARQGRFPVGLAVDYVLQACEALEEAHVHGIVHRDIKPANLFLAKRSGRAIVKVLDFGISKLPVSTADVALTAKHELIGSPAYMSPEQMLSAATADVRSDVWALGVVLYELLSGEPPFSAETLPQMIARVIHAKHRPLSDSRPDVPPELVAIVDRCLHKDPARRFGSVAELVRALAAFGPASTPMPLGTAETVRAPLPPVEPGSIARRRPKGRWPIAVILGGALVVTCCAVGAFLLARHERVVDAAPGLASSETTASSLGPSEPPPVEARGRTLEQIAAGLGAQGTVIAQSDFSPGAPHILAMKEAAYVHAAIDDGRFVVQILSPGGHYASFVRPEIDGDFLLHAKVDVTARSEEGTALIQWGHGHVWFDLHVPSEGRVYGVFRDASAQTSKRFNAISHLPHGSEEHTLDVRHRSEHVSVWLDGTEVLSEVPAPIRPRTLGLGADHVGRVAYDDVVVVRLR